VLRARCFSIFSFLFTVLPELCGPNSRQGLSFLLSRLIRIAFFLPHPQTFLLFHPLPFFFFQMVGVLSGPNVQFPRSSFGLSPPLIRPPPDFSPFGLNISFWTDGPHSQWSPSFTQMRPCPSFRGFLGAVSFGEWAFLEFPPGGPPDPIHLLGLNTSLSLWRR